MATFRFFLVGTSQSPIVEVEHANLQDLHATIECRRFLLGKMTEIDGYDVGCGVLIPINRIQMISEIEI